LGKGYRPRTPYQFWQDIAQTINLKEQKPAKGVRHGG
jgi:hypothetical protein